MKWILEQFKSMDWLNRSELKDYFPLGVDGSVIVRNKVAQDLKRLIGNVILSSNTVSSLYSIDEFMTDLYNGTWNSLLQGGELVEGDKILQKVVVNMCCLVEVKM